jgi:hypothetical protein
LHPVLAVVCELEQENAMKKLTVFVMAVIGIGLLVVGAMGCKASGEIGDRGSIVSPR